MELINPKDLYFGRAGFLGKIQSSIIMNVGGLKKINKLYSNAITHKGPYCEALLELLDIKYTVNPDDIGNIPATGPTIVIANHPTGALDGIVLIDLLSKIRPDVKFMGNFLLDRIEPLKQYFINVDPFDIRNQNNISGIRSSMQHLERGGMLVIFPAGEVATWQKGFRNIKDKPWASSVLRFIRKAGAPIIPIHITGRNSRAFHLAGKLHPMLRTALLPHELVNKRGAEISLRVGSSVISSKFDEVLPLEVFGNYLRANVEYLKPLLERRRPRRAARRAARRGVSEIAMAAQREAIIGEIDALTDDSRLFSYGQYDVFCTTPEQIPYTMFEIARLREITFRSIGEGSNHDIDTDRFDEYYHQLFIWDSAAKAIVGAYRMGFGKEIMAKYGLKGFYTNTLFKMLPELGDVMSKTIELGRSFITQEYQRKAISLMLLWKGILYVILKNDHYRYLLGPVTISGEFKTSSKLLITGFLKKNHLDRQKSKWVKPLTGIAIRQKIDISLIDGIKSIDLVNKIVADIEQNRFTIPVLVRKYMQLNSTVLGFNTDHEFCDALDTLILLDLKHIPEETILMLSKELTDIDVIGRFKKVTD